MFGPEAVEVGRGDADDLNGIDRRDVGGARSTVDDGDLAERIARPGEADAQLPPSLELTAMRSRPRATT